MDMPHPVKLQGAQGPSRITAAFMTSRGPELITFQRILGTMLPSSRCLLSSSLKVSLFLRSCRRFSSFSSSLRAFSFFSRSLQAEVLQNAFWRKRKETTCKILQGLPDEVLENLQASEFVERLILVFPF